MHWLPRVKPKGSVTEYVDKEAITVTLTSVDILISQIMHIKFISFYLLFLGVDNSEVSERGSRQVLCTPSPCHSTLDRNYLLKNRVLSVQWMTIFFPVQLRQVSCLWAWGIYYSKLSLRFMTHCLSPKLRSQNQVSYFPCMFLECAVQRR